jgi:hypothetical protein
MVSRRSSVHSTLNIVVSAAAIFAVLWLHPTAEGMLQTLLVAIAAALSLQILKLCSSTALNSHESNEE